MAGPAMRYFPAMDAGLTQLPALVAGLAFALAFVFGAVASASISARWARSSTSSNFGDWRRMRMWLLAIAVAIAGTGALQAAGLIDLSKSIYTGAAGELAVAARRRLPVRLRHDASRRVAAARR